MHHFREQSTPFEYPAEPTREEIDRERELEILRGVVRFARQAVLEDKHGRPRNPRAIAMRLRVVLAILDPTHSASLRQTARSLGVSHVALSHIAAELSRRFGITAGWQSSGAAVLAEVNAVRAARREARAAMKANQTERIGCINAA